MFKEPFFIIGFLLSLFCTYTIFVLLWRKLKLRSVNKLMMFIVCCLLIPIHIKIGTIIWIKLKESYTSHEYTNAKWRAVPNQRYEIINSLLNRFKFEGSTKEIIFNELGPPDSNYSDSIWVYSLGIRPGMHIDPDILVLYFHDSFVKKHEVEIEGRSTKN